MVKRENEIGPYIQETTHKLLVNCRYNPYADTGDNVTFIVPITNQEQVHLHVPDDEKYKSEGYPLWLIGFPLSYSFDFPRYINSLICVFCTSVLW